MCFLLLPLWSRSLSVCVFVCVGVFVFHPRFASGLRNFELASTFWSRVVFFLAAFAAACDIAWLFNEIDRLSKRVDCCCCSPVLLLCPGKRSKVSTRKKWHIKWSPSIKWKSFKYPTAPAAVHATCLPRGHYSSTVYFPTVSHSLPTLICHSLNTVSAQFVHD